MPHGGKAVTGDLLHCYLMILREKSGKGCAWRVESGEKGKDWRNETDVGGGQAGKAQMEPGLDQPLALPFNPQLSLAACSVLGRGTRAARRVRTLCGAG